jgi:hypothetical protein
VEESRGEGRSRGEKRRGEEIKGERVEERGGE